MSLTDRMARAAGAVPGFVWAILGGVLWALCFGKQGMLLAPWVALAPLLLLLGQRRAPGLAFIHGTAFWLASLYWIVPTLMTFGRLPSGLALLGLLLLAAFLSLLFWVPFGIVGRRLWRARGWRLLLGLPALWVALEWLREFLLSGFPWNLAAYAVVEVPGARPVAALVGSYGVTFLILAVNAAVALSLAERRPRPTVAAAGAALVLLFLGWWMRPEPEVAADASQVRVLQPNIPNLVEWDRLKVEDNYRNAISQADEACRPGTLVILPESALWPYIYGRDERVAADLDRLADRGCRLLINSLNAVNGGESEDDLAATYFNSALLIGADGIEGRYDKRHLVPFGEYVPFAGLFEWLDKLSRMAGNFKAGTEPGLLDWGGEKLGAAICYEVVYATNVAAQVRAGATILVTVTNDAWYGDTTAPWQHLRAAQFRAAENARPMLRSAITGVSAVIAADGSIVSQLGVGERGILAADIAGRRELTLYARAPWLIPLASTLLALAAYAKVRRRRIPPSDPERAL